MYLGVILFRPVMMEVVPNKVNRVKPEDCCEEQPGHTAPKLGDHSTAVLEHVTFKPCCSFRDNRHDTRPSDTLEIVQVVRGILGVEYVDRCISYHSVDTHYRNMTQGQTQGAQEEGSSVVNGLAEEGGRNDVLVVVNYQAEQFMGLDLIQKVLMAEFGDAGMQSLRAVYDEGDSIFENLVHAISSDRGDSKIEQERLDRIKEFVGLLNNEMKGT